MDRLEKVIKGLECCIKRNPDDKTRCGECPYESACLNRLKADAIALLKVQEPVEPILRGGIGGYWYCSACNYQISRGDKFCRYCGRAVKWK